MFQPIIVMMGENSTNVKGVPLLNSADWPKDIGSDIELLLGLDGDGSGLSDEDLLLAQSVFCDSTYSGSAVQEIVCQYNGTTGGLWQIANKLNNLRSKFSPDNPLHEHARMERRLLSAEKIKKGYALLEEILLKVKDELASNPNLSPQEKVKLVYTVMQDVGITFRDQENSLFFENLADESVDCDSSSFILMAVAHELNWPLHLVDVTGHAFVRWQGEKEAFNIDVGEIYPDEYYMNGYPISREEIIEGSNYFPIVHCNLGILLKKLGRDKEAEVEYRTAIALDPKNCDAHNNLGILLEKLGRDKEAEVEYRTAIALDPKYADAYNNLGILLEKLGRDEEAEAEFRKAIALDPKNAGTHYNFGILLEKLGRDEEAEAEFRKAIALNPKFAFAYCGLGIVLEKLGRDEEAEAEYKKAIELDPKNADVHFNLSLLYSYKLDKRGAALMCAEEAYRLRPDNVEFKEWRDRLKSKAQEKRQKSQTD